MMLNHRSTNSLSQYNLWGHEARRNPHAFYAKLRNEEPISRVISPHTGNPLWLFTRYDDVQAVLKNPAFIKDYSRFMPVGRPEESSKTPTSSLDRHLLTLDPPD